MNKFLMIVTAFGCVVISTVFTSCGANGTSFVPVNPPPGKGVVYIYQQTRLGCVATGTLKANGNLITIIRHGGYFPYVGQPGDTIFVTKIDWNRKATVRVEQGKSKYLKAEIAQPTARILKLTEVPASIGASEIKECKLLEPISRETGSPQQRTAPGTHILDPSNPYGILQQQQLDAYSRLR
jgi:hypothetical protein